MSQSESLKEALEYIQNSRFAVLNYVRVDSAPVSRAMGSFALDGTAIVFSSQVDAPKVEAIKTNKRVSFFFEQDNQELPKWKNVLAIGNAELVEKADEKNKAAAILAQKNPRLKETIEKGELHKVALFKLKTDEIQYLNRAKTVGSNEKILINN